MFKASEITFLKILFSRKAVEIHIFCEDDIVYYWRSLQDDTRTYIMSPRTGAEYNNFVDEIKNSCPLLMELV